MSSPPHRDASLSLSRRHRLRTKLSAIMSKIKEKLGKLKNKIKDEVDELQGDLSRLKVAAAVSDRSPHESGMTSIALFYALHNHMYREY